MTQRISFIGTLTILVIALFVASYSLVRANPSQLYRSNPSTATTTLSYIPIGTATTTNTFNTQIDGGTIPETAVFTECLTASSTLTVLNTTFEYSYDGVTYFQDNLSASTTVTNSIVTPNSFSWTYASSTIGGQTPSGSNNSLCKVLAIRTPLPWVRAVMTTTGANGAVWSDFGAKREQR